ncbi:hypothetical protein [Halomicrobium katesii]|nr:hypothetical protein [Halomicrobium katesii]
MFDRRDTDCQTESPIVRIDPTAFETLSLSRPADSPSIVRWFDTLAGGS